MSAIAQTSREERFINSLEDLIEKNDRAALAALRRGLGKQAGAAMEMHRYVVPHLYGMQYQNDEKPYYIVAALVGLYPIVSWRSGANRYDTNLGASLALLKQESGDSLERRFVALLNAHANELPEHLRQAISLLKSKDKPVDWLQLLNDTKRWDSEDNRVQRRWAKGFWGQDQSGNEADSNAAAIQATTTENE